MQKGDIILTPFPFSDLKGSKKRPAIILISSEYDVTICFITTQLKRQSKHDITINPTKINGLKKTSLIKVDKIATIDKKLPIGLLGHLDDSYLVKLNNSLKAIFKLNASLS